MSEMVTSKNGIEIRLPDERWEHIITGHGELADMQQNVLDTISEPERVLAGGAGELLAVREIEAGKWLVVAYREAGEDGFIITAFMTRRHQSLDKREQLWP
ncbi:MAG: hypothetical protein JXJ20_14405 [Anaerolineae bacterium]|nr:hypothetical protein [Anaerolineae bacterium]